MLLALLTVLLQFERARMYNNITIGNKTLFTRGPVQLTWSAARETCGNMSSVILPGMRDIRALGLLRVGEFAWIDGKQYRFCRAESKHVNKTEEKCRYVTTRREGIRENLTYICDTDGGYQTKDEMVTYDDAIKQCMKSHFSLMVVKNFAIPVVVPLNKISWVENFNESSINSSLGPGQTVTSSCIGVIRLDQEKFEFGTTPCDENHTFICDASGFKTALSFTTREENMPGLGDIKARINSNSLEDYNLIFILTGTIGGVLFVAIAINVLYRKLKLNRNFQYLRKSQQRSHAVQRNYIEQISREPAVKMLDETTTLQNPVPETTQGQSNTLDNMKADSDYDMNDSSFSSSQNSPDIRSSPIYSNRQEYALLAKQAALCGQAVSIRSQTRILPARDVTTIHKQQATTGKNMEHSNVLYTTDEEKYFRKAEMPSEYQVTILDSI